MRFHCLTTGGTFSPVLSLHQGCPVNIGISTHLPFSLFPRLSRVKRPNTKSIPLPERPLKRLRIVLSGYSNLFLFLGVPLFHRGDLMISSLERVLTTISISWTLRQYFFDISFQIFFNNGEICGGFLVVRATTQWVIQIVRSLQFLNFVPPPPPPFSSLFVSFKLTSPSERSFLALSPLPKVMFSA